MATISFTSSPMRLNTSSCKGNTASSARARPARGTRKFVRNIVIASTNPASASGFEDTEGRALDRQISGGKSGVNHAARMAFFGSVELESAIARQTSGGLRAETQRLAKEASDSVRPEIARALEAQTWIEAWRAKSPDIARAQEAQAWIQNWRNKPAPSTESPEVDESVLFEISERVNERAAWIAKWRRANIARARSTSWNAPLLSGEQEVEALQRQMGMTTKAEGVDREQPDKDVWGCTDNNADNFAPHSKYDDGSCVYKF